jgi:hypothetical protein
MHVVYHGLLSIRLHMNTQYGCIYYQTWGTIKHEGGNQQVRHVVYKQFHIEYKLHNPFHRLSSPLGSFWSSRIISLPARYDYL